MNDSRGFRRLFRLPARRRDEVAREVDEELRAHVELCVDALRRRGWSEGEARAEAERRFGDLEAARRRLTRSAVERNVLIDRRERLRAVWHDARLALRRVRRARAFAALAVLTMALAVGATTAIFTVVDHALFRPLPFPAPERLVALSAMDSTGDAFGLVSAADWVDWKARNRTLAASALYGFPVPYPVDAGDGGGAERVPARRVSGDFFAVLGTPMLVGRAFTAAEVEAREPVVVVREGYWRRALGADPALRRPLRVGGRPHAVVGVVPDDRAFPDGTDLWVGLVPRQGVGSGERTWVQWYAVGRLAPGVTVDRARDDLSAVARSIRAEDPSAIYAHGVGVTALHEAVVGERPATLRALLGAVALVLLVACANLAGANVARGTARASELALRAAIGAPRARIVQQLLVEQLLLAAAGGALGVGLAWWLVRAMLATAADQIPRAAEVQLDARVLAFSAAVTLGAGLLSGLVPALWLSRASLRAGISRGGRGAVAGGRGAPGAMLAAAEIALALVLVTGTGLLVRSLRTVLARDLGYRPDDVLVVGLSLAGSSFAGDSTRSAAFWDALLPALRTLPGVTAAAAGDAVPFGIAGTTFVDLPGQPHARDGAGYRLVSDDYFRTLGVPLLAGRALDGGDGRGGEPVVVVNAATAARFWPGESALGKRLRASGTEGAVDGTGAPWRTVVGVVGDIRHFGFDEEPRPEIYVPYRQHQARAGGVTAVVRTALPAASMAAAVRRRVHAVDPRVAVETELLRARVDRSLAPRRFPLAVLSGFSTLALLLAAVGLYSVLAYTVAQRTRDLAVRLALGAARRRVLGLVLGEALRVIGWGAAAGIIGAWAATRLMTSMLAGVRPTDPVSLLAAVALLAVVGLLAAAVPTVRAVRVDPIVTLRAE